MRQWASFSAGPSTSSNKVSSTSNVCEVRYPFGVQNDLGRVVLRGQIPVSIFKILSSLPNSFFMDIFKPELRSYVVHLLYMSQN